MSVKYAEDSIPLSTLDTSRRKWIPNDINKEDLLVNIIND